MTPIFFLLASDVRSCYEFYLIYDSPHMCLKACLHIATPSPSSFIIVPMVTKEPLNGDGTCKQALSFFELVKVNITCNIDIKVKYSEIESMYSSCRKITLFT